LGGRIRKTAGSLSRLENAPQQSPVLWPGGQSASVNVAAALKNNRPSEQPTAKLHRAVANHAKNHASTATQKLTRFSDRL
jgi:hypothetical protein